MRTQEPLAVGMSHHLLDDLQGRSGALIALVSHHLLDDLQGRSGALIALVDLFNIHGRRAFRATIEDLSDLPRWRERGARQMFALAISTLHVKGYIRWMPGDKYRIVSRDILTDIEYEQAYPGETWDSGIPRRPQAAPKGCRP